MKSLRTYYTIGMKEIEQTSTKVTTINNNKWNLNFIKWTLHFEGGYYFS